MTDWIRSLFQRGGLGTPEKNPTEYVGARTANSLCPPNPYWMDSSEITLAENLRKSGYKTAYVGKWHLGDEAWYPEKQGYHENFGGCDYGQPLVFDPYNNPKHRHPTIRAGIHKLPGRKPGEYLTHREADEAVKLIRKWKDRPFFIQVSHYAVHTPIQAIQEVADKYKFKEGMSETNRKYAAMVESIDDYICATCCRELKKHGIDENTLIIFTSDNGGLDRNGNPTDNAPLRSGKGYCYEGGIRVPFLVRWPAKVPAGKTSDFPISSIDLFPTIMEATGTKLPKDRPIDGLSLGKHLESGGKKSPNRGNLDLAFPSLPSCPGPLFHYPKG